MHRKYREQPVQPEIMSSRDHQREKLGLLDLPVEIFQMIVDEMAWSVSSKLVFPVKLAIGEHKMQMSVTLTRATPLQLVNSKWSPK